MDEVTLRPAIMNGCEGWIRPDGSFMPLIAGGSGEGEGSEGSEGEEEEEEGEEEEEEIDREKDPQKKIDALNSQLDRAYRKTRKLEKNLKEKEDKEREEEGKKKDELTRATEKATELETTVTSLQERVRNVTIDKLILTHPSIISLSDRKKKLAMKLIDRDDVELDDDDEEDNNVDEVIKALIKDEPDLFKTPKGEEEGEEEEDEEEEDEDETPPKRTGRPPKKRKGSKEVDESSLRTRMPALAKHGSRVAR